MLICICGKSCSGKSTLSKIIIEHIDNAIYIDVDKIAHDVLKINDVKNKLMERFGNGIISNNNIDRKKLGLIVFNSTYAMNELANITWKYMECEIDKIIENNKNKFIIIDYILLPKTKYFKMSNIKILLDVPYEIRKARALTRDNINENLFALREKSSMEYNYSDFNYVIKDDDIDNLDFNKIKYLFKNIYHE